MKKQLFKKLFACPSTAKLICYLAIAVIALSFFACQKNNDIPSTGSTSGTGNGSVQGIITDLNSAPVSNATVTGGTATTTTDANGKFILAKVQFTSDSVLVNVTKSGFFEGSKKFASTTNAVTNAIIKLIPKPVSETFSASSGGNVNVSSGGSINFNAGFINAANGNAYSGNVSVSATYLNPTDQNFSANVPGNIKGVSSTNQQGVLQSFGVVAVDLNDAAGNKLQLASGKTATITLPIPATLQSNAPSSIPLWYFDHTNGRWIQQGIATKQSSNYVGVVNHFSFWTTANLSDTAQYIHLTLNGKDYLWAFPRNVTQSHDTITTLRGGNASDQDSATYILCGINTANTSAGNYPFTIYTIINFNKYYNTYYPNGNPNTVVTQYDAIGGYIIGSATGWIKNFPAPITDSVAFNCTYRVKRIQ
jgi:hypothetical protein